MKAKYAAGMKGMDVREQSRHLKALFGDMLLQDLEAIELGPEREMQCEVLIEMMRSRGIDPKDSVMEEIEDEDNDYDAELAQSSSALDPSITFVRSGATLGVRSSLVGDGKRVMVELEATLTELTRLVFHPDDDAVLTGSGSNTTTVVDPSPVDPSSLETECARA